MTPRSLVLVALAGAALALARGAAPPAHAEDKPAEVGVGVTGRIVEIQVKDNSKTTTDTVLYVANVDEGDDWNLETETDVRTNLISSGLFKEVELFAEPHPKGGVKLTISARDKHSWVVAPTYYDQPTNRGFGVGFGENNLFGENKKLLLYGQLATGDSFLVAAYIDPSIRGTPFMWQYDVLFKKERVIEYAVPIDFLESPGAVRQSKLNYLNTGAKVGVKILRRLELQARLRGAYVSYDDDSLELLGDATPADVGVPDDTNVLPKPGAEGWDVSTELIARFDNRANFYGISEGTRLSFSYEDARPTLGSDFDYWYATARAEKAIRFKETGNLIIKGMFGWGEDLPFQQEFTSGGTALRGYKGRQFRGDRKFAANAEASVEMFNIKGFAMRGLVFADSSFTRFYDAEETDTFRNYLPNVITRGGASRMAPFKNAVGIGTRLYIRQIVLPLLGLDLGYGLEGGGVEVYLAIGLTDV
jgi:outer membrane protein insertion porin family